MLWGLGLIVGRHRSYKFCLIVFCVSVTVFSQMLVYTYTWTVSLLTVDLLSSCICEEHAHHLLEVAAGLGCIAVLAYMVQHSLQNIIQGGSRLVQQDTGPRQKAIQVTVCPNFLLKVHQLHILWKRLNSFKV